MIKVIAAVVATVLGRRIAFNTDRPLEATLEELRRELDRMLVPPPG